MHAADSSVTLAHQWLAFQPRGLALRTVNANEIVRHMETAIRRFLRPGIQLVVTPSVNRALVKIDRAQLEQVLLNLLVNAIDAMNDGGVLTMSVSEHSAGDSAGNGTPTVADGEWVHVTVKDTGCGMDAATRRRVFEPFFTTKNCGAGVGLASALGIVNQMGGHMSFTSELGKGSTFTVCLPRVEESTMETVRDLPTHIPEGTETILLVENNDHERTAVRDALQSRGYKVLTARHGSDALLICRQFPAMIQLMITNTVMPQMSGRQLADLLRSLRPQMRVLYLSSHLDDQVGTFEHLDDRGAMVPRPPMPDGLLQTVRDVLGKDRGPTSGMDTRKSGMGACS